MKIWNHVKQLFIDQNEHIDDGLFGIKRDIIADVNTTIGASETKVIAAGGAEATAITSTISFALNTIIIPSLATIGAVLITLGEAYTTTLSGIGKSITSIDKTLLDLPSTLDDAFDRFLQKLEDLLPEPHKKLIRKKLIIEISEKVALRVVGESFYKWNSLNSFYPILVFKFKKTNVADKARTTRLKMKLKYSSKELSKEFSDEIIAELRKKTNEQAGLTYKHGSIRGNFASQENKRSALKQRFLGRLKLE